MSVTISVGDRFGRLVVLERIPGSRTVEPRFRCACDCGSECVVRRVLLRLGKTKSCGCLRRENTGKLNLVHGKGHSKINYVWQEMKSRCRNEQHKRYADYGGRGITYDPRWEDFKCFLDDMYDTYEEGLTIDRIDNDGNYCKKNCRWVGMDVQNRNKRNTVYDTINGITDNRVELCRRFGVQYQTLWWRLNHGYTLEQAYGIEPPPSRTRNRR